MSKNVIVIGSGFSGISLATNLAHSGYNVKVLEKNDIAGGRARFFSEEGFTFDMGPSWYWMPDVFDDYFNRFGHETSEFYELVRLDPSYTVVFDKDNFINVPASFTALQFLFDSIEEGSGEKLELFLQQAAYKYKVGMKDLVFRPGRSVTEFLSVKLLLDILRMDIFKSFHSHVRNYFKHPYLLQIAEFPILFLGAVPQNTPALYSLMNFADMKLGTWYPKGGMYKIVEGMVSLAESIGVEFLFRQTVSSIIIDDHGNAVGVEANGKVIDADIVVASADYQHVEQTLLPKKFRTYDEEYWNSRVMAPGSLIFYLGIDKKLERLNHHNLFFDEDFAQHAIQIYEKPSWPDKPLFYVSVTSKTDDSVAPEGCENLFILIPVAPDLKDTEATREDYYNLVLDRLEVLTNQPIKKHVVFKRSYAHNDFMRDYNAFKGNAYGLANTLKQTAILKPAMKSSKVKNLYYTGQLTVPGPGVPPSLISGQIVATEIEKDFPIDK